MPETYPCIIVDDDEIDRLTTLSFVKRYPLFDIIGVFTSAEEALASLDGKLPSIAFFDIDMPGISGLDLRRKLDTIPACVFITSFPDYAVESFELAAIDYMVKPIKADRFAKTVQRIEDFFAMKQKSDLFTMSLGADTVLIKQGHEQVKLPLHEIIYLEALKDFTYVVTSSKKYCVSDSLGAMLKQHGFASFLRVHKSYAVQQQFIERFKSQELIVKGISIPVGRAYKSVLDELK